MTTTYPTIPGQPDGIEDDSRDTPDPARAAERVNEYISAFGDGLYDVIDGHPLYGRDLYALTKVVTGELAGLRAELAKVREQLTAANHHTDGLAADVRDMQKANTAYANENARLRTQLAEADAHPCNCCFVNGSTQRCGRTATTEVDVAPFGHLDVADACKARINGTAVAR